MISLKRNICLFTSTRADWGLFKRLAAKIRESDSLKLTLLVSGSHLSKRLGNTYTEIQADGFPLEHRVEILHEDDSPLGTCLTMGRALAAYAEELERIRPDLLLVLGDRYETSCVVAAAQVLMIPVAHIHGGETTEGAIDEAFRHSITKMSHIHFPACETYRKRILRMGEQPELVHTFGSLGVENIHQMDFLPFDAWAGSVSLPFDKPFFLITFHPVTLENATAENQFEEVISALESFPDHNILITKANADTNANIINKRIDAYAEQHPKRCFAVSSLGMHRYLSAMKDCAVVIGNSSSGMIESPVLGIPTVNIGDRQKGRIRVESIIDCPPNRHDITKAINKAIHPDFKKSIEGIKHPCDQPGTANKIYEILKKTSLDGILKKKFYDGNEGLI